MRSLFFFLIGFIPVWGGAQDFNPFADPIATTVQLPTFGVSFDAEGVLQLKTFRDPTGQLRQQRAAAAKANLAGRLGEPVKARYVSLVRLERAIRQRLEAGKEPTSEVMSKLAGLLRIEAAFCFPDRDDIVLVGPAEPWMEDLSGRTVGIRSRRPTLLLEDLIVALRAYPPELDNRLFVGCTISPRADGLARLQAFQRTIPRSISQRDRAKVSANVARGVKESLGMANVKVFGVSPRSHMAQVMIEADYRMKRIAIGVEPPPVKMTTFASAMTTAQQTALQRWWFTPLYEGVLVSKDRMSMRLDGQGVRLQTEIKRVDKDGRIIGGNGKPSRATKAFATSFTKRYSDVARVSPVYAQLRQVTDLLIVAAYMRRHRWYRDAGWDASVLRDESAVQTGDYPTPRTAPVVVNTFWKANRMFTPAGGGVSIDVEEALKAIKEDDRLDARRGDIDPPDDASRWWWD